MSSQPLRTVSANGGTLIPWQKGQSGNPGGLTKVERAWRKALDDDLIEDAVLLGKKIVARALREVDSDLSEGADGSQGPKWCELAAKMLAMMPKTTDKALIEAAIVEGLRQAIDAARARRQSSTETDPSGRDDEQETRDPAK